jgi:hypothetical protein
MSLKWDYKNRTHDISIPGHVSKILSKFQHDTPKHPHNTPSKYVMSVYEKPQYVTQDETTPLMVKIV